MKIFIDDFGTGYSSFNYLKTQNCHSIFILVDRVLLKNLKRSF
ncbi:hypothetical protein [Lysinibacillus sp. SGAir0095]